MTDPKRWRVVAYMVALFAAGAITGGAVMSRMTPAGQTLKVGRSDEIARMITEKLDTRLQLTPEQNQKFAPLIKHASDELEASHLDCLKRISAAIDLLHQQMAPDLTPEQKEKMKALEAERENNMRAKYNFTLEPAKTNAP
jgi:Spy/CpxP family protein refolding chaperone